MSSETNQESEMPFLEHLSELRTRLIISIASVCVLAGVSFVWATQLFKFLTLPLIEGTTKTVNLIGTGPAEAFIVKLKVSLGAGVILASPILFYQIWRFVAPGLLDKEKRYAIPFVFFTSFFFLIGISFCYYLVLPFAFEFFVEEFLSIGVSPDIRIGEYLSFTIRILLVFGLVFELPILSFFGALVGVVTSSWLRGKGRFAIVGIFVCAALLTPPDVITQCLLAVPLMILYFLCILITSSVEKSRKES